VDPVLLEQCAETRPPEQTHAAVPPTVSPSIRNVG